MTDSYSFTIISPGSEGGTGSVSSVFGRTGAVMAQSGDYTFSQIGGVLVPGQMPIFTATFPGAVPGSGGGTTNFLRADGAWTTPPVTSVFGRTGNVVAATNDYSFSQISGVAAPAQLPLFTSVANGAVAASGGGTTNFLRADGTWVAPGTGGAGNITLGSTTITGGLAGRVLYDNSGLVGEYTPAQLTAQIANFTNVLSGTVPASGGGTTNFLRADGTWTAPPVTSVFGRTGAVTAQANDYSFSQISGSVAATQMPALTGDVTTTAGTVATTIANGAVTLPKMANLPANTVIGNNTGSPATPIALSQAQLTAMVNTFTTTLAGDVPASGGGTTNFLRADGTWTSPGSAPVTSVFTRTGAVTAQSGDYSFSQISGSVASTQMPALTGDVTSTAGTTATTIANHAVTNAKFRQSVGLSVVGNAGTAGADVADIVGTASQFLGVNAAGTVLGFETMAGDATLSGPTLTIANGAVSLAKMANLAANTVIGNNTGSPATPIALSKAQLTAMINAFTTALSGAVPASGGGTTNFLRADGTWVAPPAGSASAPTVQRFTTGSALTYTPTGGMVRIKVRMCAGGGGGGAVSTNNGSNGGDTSFGTWTAVHGNGGPFGGGTTGGAGGTGGTNGTGTLVFRQPGQPGGPTLFISGNLSWGGVGGNNHFVGGAQTTVQNTGANAVANTGGGGSGGSTANVSGGGGGGAGEYVEFWMTAAQVGASLTYTVGSAGNGGAAGSVAGGNGAAGIIIIEEFYV